MRPSKRRGRDSGRVAHGRPAPLPVAGRRQDLTWFQSLSKDVATCATIDGTPTGVAVRGLHRRFRRLASATRLRVGCPRRPPPLQPRGRAGNGAPRDFCRPGVKLLNLSSPAHARGAAGPLRRARAQPRAGGRRTVSGVSGALTTETLQCSRPRWVVVPPQWGARALIKLGDATQDSQRDAGPVRLGKSAPAPWGRASRASLIPSDPQLPARSAGGWPRRKL